MRQEFKNSNRKLDSYVFDMSKSRAVVCFSLDQLVNGIFHFHWLSMNRWIKENAQKEKRKEKKSLIRKRNLSGKIRIDFIGIFDEETNLLLLRLNNFKVFKLL